MAIRQLTDTCNSGLSLEPTLASGVSSANIGVSNCQLPNMNQRKVAWKNIFDIFCPGTGVLKSGLMDRRSKALLNNDCIHIFKRMS